MVHADTLATSGKIKQVSANATANIEHQAELKALQVSAVGSLHIQEALPPFSLTQQAYCIFFLLSARHRKPLYLSRYPTMRLAVGSGER